MTLAGNLLRKANARLSELVKGVTSMELTIVDESDTGADIGISGQGCMCAAFLNRTGLTEHTSA